MYAKITIVLTLGLLGVVNAMPPEGAVVIETVESEPSEKFVAQIHDSFKRADTIKVSYIPRQHLGRGSFPKEKLLNDWEFQFLYRCAGRSCTNRAENIQSFLSSGLKLETECPGPYYAALELLGRDEQVTLIFVDHTGRCFTVKGKSYHTPFNFDAFVKPEALYPDFVKP